VDWDLAQLKRMFRADSKRMRPTYDSYQLFLDGKAATSRAWTVDEAMRDRMHTPWHIETGKLQEQTALAENAVFDF